MSPELETLDQLQGGELPLLVVRKLYPSDTAFFQGIAGLLAGGDIRLLDDESEIPEWRWNRLLEATHVRQELYLLRICITEQGTRRIR